MSEDREPREPKALIRSGAPPTWEMWRGEDDVRAAYPYPYAEDDGARWRSRLDVLLQHKWLLVVCALAGMAYGHHEAGKEVPIYEATAVLRLTSPERSLAGLSVGNAVAGPDLMTELELLRSRRMGRILADSLDLTVQTDPAVRAVLAGVHIDEAAGGGTARLSFEEEGYMALGSEGGVVARASYGEPLRLGFGSLVATGPPEGVREASVRLVAPRAAADAVRGGLRARVRGNTRIVDLSYQSTDPELAARVVNTAARVYREQSEEAARRQARARRTFLAAQLERAEEEYAAARARYDRFQEERGLVSAGARLSRWHEGTLQTETEQMKLESDREILDSILASIEDSDPSDAKLQTLVYAPVISQNPMVQDLYQRYLELKEERESLTSGEFGLAASSPEIQKIEIMARNTKEEILAAARNLRAILDQRIRAAQTALNQARSGVGELPSDAAEEEEIVRRLQASQAVMEELRSALMRTRIEEVQEAGYVDIVDPAPLPLSPTRARGFPKQMIGLLFGLMVGVVGAFGLERLDTTIKGSDEVEVTLQVPELAAIPRTGGKKRSPEMLERLMPGRRRDRGDRDIQIVQSTPGKRGAPAAEAFKALRTNLMFSQAVRELQTLVITSSSPFEGKTTTAVNLAAAFAQQGVRTLIVDADLRRPQLHNLFNIRRSPGLTDILLGQAGEDGTVMHTQYTNLFALAAGSEAFNPSEMLGSERFERFAETIRESFDLVIFDSPPVLAVTDAAVLGASCDGVVLVVRAGSTERKAATNGLNRLRDVGARVVGCVVNDVDAGGNGGYYTYEYHG